jgi:hypothetical protein
MSNASFTSGAIQEFLYESGELLLNGTIPAAGWSFYWSTCCRFPSTNYTNQTINASTYLIAKLYALNSSNGAPCYFSSPTFAEPPQTIFETGKEYYVYPNIQSNNMYDSLVYEWGHVLQGANQNVTTFQTGYSATSPFPNTSHNANNIPASINSENGTMHFKSHNAGSFLTNLRVKCYNHGSLISEVMREFQYSIQAGNTNAAPVVSSTVNSASPFLFVDTVYAGDLINHSFSALDLGVHPDGSFQVMNLKFTGKQFGQFEAANGSIPAHLNDSIGCLSPPCATLSSSIGSSDFTTAMYGLGVDFKWQTQPHHLKIADPNVCPYHYKNTYDFFLTFKDDQCPVPAYTTRQIRIVLKARPALEENPELKCIQVEANGNTKVYFNPVKDSIGSFHHYELYASSTKNGPYNLVSKELNRKKNCIHHNGALADQHPVYYFLKMTSGTKIHTLDSLYSDTIASIFLEDKSIVADFADLEWNVPHPNLTSSSTNQYHIYENINNQLSYDGSNMSTSYIDSTWECSVLKNYKVELMSTGLEDSTGNVFNLPFISNYTAPAIYEKAIPQTPVINSVVVSNLTNQSQISWQCDHASSNAYYIIFKLVMNQWINYDTVFGGTNLQYTDQVAAYAQNDHYVIQAVDSCDNKSQVSLPFGTAIHTSDRFQISLYPNPCQGKIWLTEQVDQVRIMNTLGQELKLIYLPSKEISLEELESGTYLIEIMHQSKTITKVLIIE